MTKMTVLYAVFVALMLLVVVRRHTRSEEETGQAELLGGTAIGRDAALAAAVSFGAIISVVVGLLAALAEHGGRAAGRRIPAVRRLVGRDRPRRHRCSPRSRASSRRARAPARPSPAAGIGVLFLLRAVGDTSVSWLSWLSPFGWSTQLRAWSEPRWWVLLLYVATFVGLVTAAQALRGARDLGLGHGRGPTRTGDRLTAALRRDRAQPAPAHPDAGRPGRSPWARWAWCSGRSLPTSATCSTRPAPGRSSSASAGGAPSRTR